MKRLSLALAILMLAGLSATAEAAQGFYDAYGYQMPSKAQRAAKPKNSKITSGGAPQAFKKKKLAMAVDAADEEPVKKKKQKQQADDDSGGGEMSGGPRPSIAPMAPKKVAFSNSYGAGNIVIDTAGRKLYYVLSSSQAYSYPIAVGKEGFKWTGTMKISKEIDWPDWRPPAEMRERKPNLPES